MHRQHSLRKRQRGVTLIGWIILLTPVAIVGYAGIRLGPIYLNYGKIVRSMQRTAQESSSSDSAQAIRFALEKRLDIESVYFPDSKDFVIRRDGQSWYIEVQYEDAAPMVANVSLVAKFEKSVKLGKGVE
jgi:hypothetical protein